MVFFKRLSRSRSNSQSYVDRDNSYDSRHDSKTNSASYDDKYNNAPVVQSPTDLDHDQALPVSRQSNTAPQLGDPLGKETDAGAEAMYARRDRPTEVGSQDRYHSSNSYPPQQRSGNMSNGYSGSMGGSQGYPEAPSGSLKNEPAPDLLLQAFNQAIRPYSDKIEGLENEISDLKAYIDALERQRTDVHAWIDKRGLRPGKHSSFSDCRIHEPVLIAFSRRPCQYRNDHGLHFARFIAYPRCSNPQRPARPQDHDR